MIPGSTKPSAIDGDLGVNPILDNHLTPEKCPCGQAADLDDGKQYQAELKRHEALLLRLDSDRARAWDKYVGIRRRLTKLFVWNSCTKSVDLADTVLDRVAKMLGEEPGRTPREIRDVAQFCVGVARKIVQENRKAEHRSTGIEDLSDPEKELRDLHDPETEIVDKIDRERQLSCLNMCLAELGSEERKLLLLFYGAEEKKQISFRRQLAAMFGITAGNLRVRACRLRVRVETCERLCLDSAAEARRS